MTGYQSFLVDSKAVSGGVVSFGDGVKGRILGKGNLNVKGLLKLRDVLHLE